MFERYNEKARRVIFVARYEACSLGSPFIEAEHLLLGILREDKELTERVLDTRASFESVRYRIEAASGKRKPLPENADVPLSSGVMQVLTVAAEEAERRGSQQVGTEHLFLGLLRAENSMALDLIHQAPEEPPAGLESEGEGPRPAPAARPAAGLLRDLTGAAKDRLLYPVVGRDLEIDAVLEVLCGTARRNPVLVGRLGTGKTAIVEGVAQRIAAGRVPRELAGQRVIAADPEYLAPWAADRSRFDDLLELLGSLARPDETILFLDCFLRLSPSPAQGRGSLTALLSWAISRPGLRVIAVAEEREFAAAVPTAPWLEQEFRELRVRPLGEEAALAVLEQRKAMLERSHGVRYSGDALETAIEVASRDMSRAMLPRTAIELLDAAGVLVRMRRGRPPAEIVEAQRRVATIAELKGNALASREIGRARAYEDEERMEQEGLRVLLARNADRTATVDLVTSQDVKAVLTRWTVYPYAQ